MTRAFPALAALFALLLAACASPSAGPTLYLLEAPAGADQGAPQIVRSVGLREIALPLYARRPQIARLDGSGAVIAADDQRWAEDPPRAATRLVARTLAKRAGAPVYAEPWAGGAAPELIVEAEVDRFLGALGGELRLEGQMTVYRAGAAGPRKTAPFAISVPASGPGYGALAAAHGAALAQLADRMAEALAAY